MNREAMWMSHEERWRAVTLNFKVFSVLIIVEENKTITQHTYTQNTRGEEVSCVPNLAEIRAQHNVGKKCALSHNQSESQKGRNLCLLLQRQFQKDLLYSLLFKSLLLRMLFGPVSPRRFPRRAQGRANAVFPPSGSGMKSFKLLSNLQSFQSLESGQKHFLLPISVCGHLSTRPCCCLSPYYFSFFPFKQLSKLLSRLSSCATMRLLNCNLRSADLRKTLAEKVFSLLE